MKKKPAAAKTIGFFKGMSIRRAGRRDGKIGLPKEGANGNWSSPYMEMLNKAYSQREDEEFRNCAEATTDLQVKADELALEIIRHEKLQEELNLSLTASLATAETLSERFPGEEHLPESGIRARRQREHNALLAGEYAKLASSESFLKSAYSDLGKLKAEISETETETRLRVELVRANADERILIYYRAAMSKHPLREEMPAAPILATTHGEATYLSSRNADIMRIKSMQEIKQLVLNGGNEYEAV